MFNEVGMWTNDGIEEVRIVCMAGSFRAEARRDGKKMKRERRDLLLKWPLTELEALNCSTQETVG